MGKAAPATRTLIPAIFVITCVLAAACSAGATRLTPTSISATATNSAPEASATPGPQVTPPPPTPAPTAATTPVIAAPNCPGFVASTSDCDLSTAVAAAISARDWDALMARVRFFPLQCLPQVSYQACAGQPSGTAVDCADVVDYLGPAEKASVVPAVCVSRDAYRELASHFRSVYAVVRSWQYHGQRTDGAAVFVQTDSAVVYVLSLEFTTPPGDIRKIGLTAAVWPDFPDRAGALADGHQIPWPSPDASAGSSPACGSGATPEEALLHCGLSDAGDCELNVQAPGPSCSTWIDGSGDLRLYSVAAPPDAFGMALLQRSGGSWTATQAGCWQKALCRPAPFSPIIGRYDVGSAASDDNGTTTLGASWADVHADGTVQLALYFQNTGTAPVSWTSDVAVAGIYLEDANGTVYASIGVGGHFAENLRALAPGERRSGWHVFRLPTSLGRFTLFYPNHGPITIDLTGRPSLIR